MHLGAHCDVTASAQMSRVSGDGGAAFLLEAAQGVERALAAAFEAGHVAEVATLHGVAALLRAAASDLARRG